MRGVLELVAREVRLGEAAPAPAAPGMGVALLLQPPRLLRRGGARSAVSPEGRAPDREGLGRGRRRQPHHQPQRRREPGAGRGARRDLRGAGTGDHHRGRPDQAGQLPRLPAPAHPPGGPGRGPLPQDGHPAHRAGRARVAAGHPGASATRSSPRPASGCARSLYPGTTSPGPEGGGAPVIWPGTSSDQHSGHDAQHAPEDSMWRGLVVSLVGLPQVAVGGPVRPSHS